MRSGNEGSGFGRTSSRTHLFAGYRHLRMWWTIYKGGLRIFGVICVHPFGVLTSPIKFFSFLPIRDPFRAYFGLMVAEPVIRGR